MLTAKQYNQEHYYLNNKTFPSPFREIILRSGGDPNLRISLPSPLQPERQEAYSVLQPQPGLEPAGKTVRAIT